MSTPEQIINLAYEQTARYPVKCNFNPAYGYKSGEFGGGKTSKIENGILTINPFERYVGSYIQYLLDHEPKYPVRILDEGGMLGYSMIVLGYLFQKQVKNGELELYVSNFEPGINRKNLLAEANRRLILASTLKNIAGENESHPMFTDNLQVKLSAFVQTRSELDFLNVYQNLVTDVTGVDIADLGKSFRNCRDGYFDLIHDHYAGLTWSNTFYDIDLLMSRIFRYLKKSGALMTNMPLHHGNDIIKRTIETKNTARRNVYKIYALRESPILNLPFMEAETKITLT
jgi:hypothetical protein